MSGSREKLLTASDLASLCEVDLKTIHNWVDRGRIAHFRTPGRHLRFRAADVAEFLRAWGYAVPRELARATSKLIMAIGGKDSLAHVSRSLGDGVPVRHADHPYDALIYAGAEPADAFIVDVRSVPPEIELSGFFEALHRACPQGVFMALSDEPTDVPPFVTRLGRADAQGLKTALLPETQVPTAPGLSAGTGNQVQQAVGPSVVEDVPRSMASGEFPR
ncbi:helix-turn-helix domain-containing protein [Chondromyces apiculatus]|uniref:helix-turn-helix domain-containing protein n=1 Tax=Chondromyces apiculatus TaxID=51 RepID=UPI0005C65AAF|nr:helix-turn-helix domain-containing protein [Chondromyces apiculatus]